MFRVPEAGRDGSMRRLGKDLLMSPAPVVAPYTECAERKLPIVLYPPNLGGPSSWFWLMFFWGRAWGTERDVRRTGLRRKGLLRQT